jgi:hypothetical protein
VRRAAAHHEKEPGFAAPPKRRYIGGSEGRSERIREGRDEVS